MATATPKTAARKASGSKKKTTDKSVKAETAGVARPKPKYPARVSIAAARGKEITGLDHAPGPMQVAAVIKALGDRDPVTASGMTLRQLKAYAAGEMPRSESRELRKKGMRELEDKVGNPFTKSRAMAGVLLALHEAQPVKPAK